MTTDYLQRHLNCTLRKEEVHFVTRNEAADNPNENLKEKIESCVNSDSDFVIIQMGTNEISNLDTTNRPIITLHGVVTDNIKSLVNIAEAAACKYACPVFIGTLPPRYETPDTDPGGLKSKLSDLANATLTTCTLALENVHLVDTGGLRCQGRARRDRYSQDGVHLTMQGTNTLTSAWFRKVEEVLPGVTKKGGRGFTEHPTGGGAGGQRTSGGNQPNNQRFGGDTERGFGRGGCGQGSERGHGHGGDGGYRQGDQRGDRGHGRGGQGNDNGQGRGGDGGFRRGRNNYPRAPPGNNNRGWQENSRQESWGGGYRNGGGRQENESEAVRSILSFLRNGNY